MLHAENWKILTMLEFPALRRDLEDYADLKEGEMRTTGQHTVKICY